MEQFENRTDLSQLNDKVQQIREEIGKIIIGQEKVIDLLIVAILANGHVLLEGVPGIAKTLAAKLLASTTSVDFSRIQFTPDLMPSDVLGTSIFNMKTSDFEFRKGPIFSNIVLIDEINRAPAKTQAALFEVMEEKQVTMDGTTYPMGYPYLVVATQNPIEQEGTYRLPEAQLDRFLFKIVMDYPSLEEEVRIIAGHHSRKDQKPTDAITAVLTADEIKQAQAVVGTVHVEQDVLNYIAKIVHATRDNDSLYLGASPRASIALLNSSKALAAIQGRDFVTPEDVKYLAAPVMRHRIMLTPEREMEGVEAEQVIERIVEKTEVPR